MKQGRAPGVYLGLSMQEYHADPAVGSSGVKMLIENPYRYWYWSPLNPDPTRPQRPETIPTKFGTAYHTLILEPRDFKYQVKFGINESQVAGFLGEGEYKRLMQMQAKIHESPRRTALLEGGIAEVSVFWRCPITGVMCKCRFDYFAPDWIVDLKTTTSVKNQSLRHDIPDFGYDVSGYMYSLCARELKRMIAGGYQMPADFSASFVERFLSHENQLFAFMMQEKEPPYLVRCPVLTPEVAACGRDKFNLGMAEYARYQDLAGAWPDKYPDIENMEMEMLSASINYY